MSRLSVPLVLAIGIDALGAGIFAPLSLLYFVRVADLPLSTVGALATAGAVVSLPVPLLAGHLADRFGPRGVVIAGQLIQAGGFCGYLAARDVVAIFAAIGVVAVGQRLFWSSFFTLVAALPVEGGDERERDRRYAIVGMTQAAGLGVGALVAGALLAASSTAAYQALAGINAATFLVSAGLLLLLPAGERVIGERPRPLAGYRRMLGDRPYLALTVANTAFAICNTALGIALPVYVVDGLDAPGWIVGPILAVNTLLLAVGQLAMTRVMRRYSRVQALVAAGALWSAWAFLTAAAGRLPEWMLLPYLAAVTLLYSCAELIHAPISNALAAEAAPEAQRGSYLAAFQYGFTIATLAVPGAFAVLFGVDPELPWLVLGALAAAGAGVMMRLRTRLPVRAVA
jgi:MFS family permease